MTREKKGKNELRESEAMYKALFTGAAEGILVADLKTKQFRYANPAQCRMFGYTEEEFMRLGVADIHPKESLDHVLAEFEAQLTGEKTLAPDLPCLRKDGTIFYANISGTLVVLDGRKCNVGFFTDITEGKRAKEALWESQQRFQCLVETLYDWVWAVDPQGHYTYVSPRIRDILGYESEELLGKTPFDLMSAEEARRVSKIFGALVAERKPVIALENINLHKDGHQVVLETSGLPFYAAEGNFKGYRGVDRNITERKKAQTELQTMNEELRSTNEELETSNEELQSTTEELEAANEEIRTTQEELVQKEKLAAVGQLASGVGHELRNPLGVIKNAAYYIKSKIGGAADPKLAKHLDIMEREINNSNKIISDLLNFSKTRLPELIPAEINEVIEETIPVANIPENVRVNRNLTPGLPKPAIDRDQIKQVFLNLILNACQAMPEGGELKISSRLHKAGLKIEGKEKDCLEIEFADAGTGIAPENLKKMFDPFFTTKAKGIGLGLAVSKGIIEKHHGDIEIKSEPNKGATFTVKLGI
ncbi:MAG: PAS domain S-box protein [Syntrophales bacterium]|nr:PAS domain S-box protein [Syntrophales bacterium]